MMGNTAVKWNVHILIPLISIWSHMQNFNITLWIKIISAEFQRLFCNGSVNIPNDHNNNLAWTHFQEKNDSLSRRAISVYDWGRLVQVIFLHLLVALEDWRSDKGLLAQVALILLVAVVYHLDVHVERVLPLEGRIALVTLECPLTCSKSKSHFQLSIVVPLNTVIMHSKRGTHFQRGRLCGQEN